MLQFFPVTDGNNNTNNLTQSCECGVILGSGLNTKSRSLGTRLSPIREPTSGVDNKIVGGMDAVSHSIPWQVGVFNQPVNC